MKSGFVPAQSAGKYPTGAPMDGLSASHGWRAGVKVTYLVPLIALTAALSLAESGTFPSFVDVAARAGVLLMNICGGSVKNYIVEANGNGAAFFDYDRDGDADLLVTNGSTLAKYKTGGDPLGALYRNDGGHFVEVTADAGLRTRGWGMGVCVADYDNDDDEDVYITAYGPNVLYRNNGDGTFRDVTSVSKTGDARWGTNCAFGDYDRDGDVDLYVANYLTFNEATIPARGKSQTCRYLGIQVFCGPQGLGGEPDALYRNNGDGTFTDVTASAGITDPGYYGFGVLFSDFDDDGWPDIYIANDGNPNLLFHNNGDQTFSETGLLSGTALSEAGRPQSGMGVTVGDYDGNLAFDIFVTNYAGDTNTLYRNLKKLLFVDMTAAAGMGEVSLPYLGWGTGLVDLDNDGLQDIFVANGHVYPEVDALNAGQTYLQRKEIYRNNGEGKFTEIARDLGGDLLAGKSARGAAFGDYDNDGDIDIFVVNMNDRPSLYRNDGGNRNHWIAFHLKGSRSNRDAIGARIEITSGGRTQASEVRSGGSYLSHNDMRVHFGLGDKTRVDSVRIRWPNGGVQEYGAMEADRIVTLVEGK